MTSLPSRLLFGPLLLSLVGASALLACGADAPPHAGASESEILNGSKSDRRDVVLLASSRDTQACSGTIIAPDVIATAAHCLGDLTWVYVGYSKPTQNSDTKLSAPDPDGGEPTWKRYKIAESVALPGFVEQGCPMVGTADVALLRLEEPILDVTPATIAERAPSIGEECVVVGYGRHNPDEDAATNEQNNYVWSYNEQRAARVNILAMPPLLADGGSPPAPDAEADGGEAGAEVEAGPPPGPVEAHWFSAKGIDGAHSRGDSGGAIFCGGKLAGIVSCSPDRNQTVLELVKVYGNLEVSKKFIEETMRRWAETPLPKPDAGEAEGGGGGIDAGTD